MEQLLREVLLIILVVVPTILIHRFIKEPGAPKIAQIQRILTGVIGAFILLGGVAKFFDPFTTMFANQIALSQLPLPKLSAIAGQTGEIAVGLVLLGFFFMGAALKGPKAETLFHLTHGVLMVIMLVAVYVHLHPDVPAETLPFQSKPPVLTVIVMLAAGVNMSLRRRLSAN